MTESKRTARTFRWTSSINVSLGFSTGVATGVMTGGATGGRTPENWAASREKGPDPNADQISSAHPWDKPARSPFSSACGANTERAEEGDTEVAGRGLRSDGIFSFSVLASGKVFGMCFRSVAPSGKLHLQKPSVPPSSVPSVFRAASRFSKESSLTDWHSGQSPARRAKWPRHGGKWKAFHALGRHAAAKGLAALQNTRHWLRTLQSPRQASPPTLRFPQHGFVLDKRPRGPKLGA